MIRFISMPISTEKPIRREKEALLIICRASLQGQLISFRPSGCPPGVEIFDFISIFGGVNFDCGFSFAYDGYNIEVGEILAGSNTAVPGLIDFNYGQIKMYPTWFVGVRI